MRFSIAEGMINSMKFHVNAVPKGEFESQILSASEGPSNYNSKKWQSSMLSTLTSAITTNSLPTKGATADEYYVFW